ncbi:hypothetical protein KM043_005734 [Ampulex compressa]|nr:hypothetical protein KM043_005734 [Ampulex compressa]
MDDKNETFDFTPTIDTTNFQSELFKIYLVEHKSKEQCQAGSRAPDLVASANGGLETGSAASKNQPERVEPSNGEDEKTWPSFSVRFLWLSERGIPGRGGKADRKKIEEASRNTASWFFRVPERGGAGKRLVVPDRHLLEIGARGSNLVRVSHRGRGRTCRAARCFRGLET